MNSTFIRIGDRYISVAHIIEIRTDFDTTGDARVVRVVTSELLASGDGSRWIEYVHGTPEADALIAWADWQSEALVAIIEAETRRAEERAAKGFAEACYRMGYGCAQEISSHWVQLQADGRPARSMQELQERANTFIDRIRGIDE